MYEYWRSRCHIYLFPEISQYIKKSIELQTIPTGCVKPQGQFVQKVHWPNFTKIDANQILVQSDTFLMQSLTVAEL